MSGLDLLARTLSRFISNIDQVFRISAFWMSFLIFCCFLIYVLLNSGSFVPLLVLIPFGCVALFLFTCGCISMAIQWHRFLLLNERVEGFLIWPSGYPRLHYFGLNVGITVISLIVAVAVIAAIAVPILMVSDEAFDLLEPVYVEIGSFFANVSFAIFGLALPALAIRKEIRFKEAYAISKKHLAIVIVLAVIYTCLGHVSQLIHWVVSLAYGPFSTSFSVQMDSAQLVYYGANGLVYFFTTFLTTGYLSEMYREFLIDERAAIFD